MEIVLATFDRLVPGSASFDTIHDPDVTDRDCVDVVPYVLGCRSG